MKRKSVKIIQRVQKAETSVIVAVRHEISAPVTGITLCTHVGRHSSTHFDNGFSVDSIPRPKGMRERHGEKVSSLERLNKLFVRDCRNQRWRKERRGAAAEPRVWGKYREEKPWNQRTAAGWTIGVIAFNAGTQWSVLHCFSTSRYPLRWTGSITGDPSPCLQKTLRNRG